MTVEYLNDGCFVVSLDEIRVSIKGDNLEKTLALGREILERYHAENGVVGTGS